MVLAEQEEGGLLAEQQEPKVYASLVEAVVFYQLEGGGLSSRLKMQAVGQY